jgi:aspartyl-tRNA(Asn)/glutamyl-tRNA(Gln) amidotransferase subunit A
VTDVGPGIEKHRTVGTHRLEENDMTDSLTWAPAWRISELIRAKEISPVEVLEHFLGRIEEHQPVLRALEHMDDLRDRAYMDAKAASAAVLAGDELGPLHGIPIALKGHLDIEGLPQTPPFGTGIAQHDDLTVERLRGAGAVIVGHTGMAIFRGDGTYDYNATARNPWDPSRTPGISSAGSAAAVAAGLLPVAVGSDGAGSIRVPAAYSGLVGVHPTAGMVPWLGAMPWGATQSATSTIGPFARNVLDAATVLSVIAGPDGRDLIGLHVDLPDPRSELDRGADGLKIAWTDDFGFALQYAVEESSRVIGHIREAAFALNSIGATVEPATEQWENYEILMRASFATAGVATLGLERSGNVDELLEAATSLRHRNWLRFRKLFAEYDLLLCPTIHSVAPTIEVFATRIPSGMAVAEGAFGAASYSVYTGQFNQLKFPAVSVPCGFVDGLPVGLQIVGFAGTDAKVLRLAHAFVQAFPQDRRPPVS